MYRLKIKKSALKALCRLPYEARMALDRKLKELARDPFGSFLDVKKLKGHDLYRVRVRDYRVIYQKNDRELILLVVTVAHRKEAYS